MLKGFTLLEVLIALAILSVALGILFQSISNSIANSRSAEEESRATVLAQSIIAQLGKEILIEPGEFSGISAAGQQWKLQQTEMAGEAGSGKLKRYRETVTVEWGTGGARRKITLSTLRLGLESEQP